MKVELSEWLGQLCSMTQLLIQAISCCHSIKDHSSRINAATKEAQSLLLSCSRQKKRMNWWPNTTLAPSSYEKSIPIEEHTRSREEKGRRVENVSWTELHPVASRNQIWWSNMHLIHENLILQMHPLEWPEWTLDADGGTITTLPLMVKYLTFDQVASCKMNHPLSHVFSMCLHASVDVCVCVCECMCLCVQVSMCVCVN